MFSYVSKENKAFLSIDNDHLHAQVHSPELHFEVQARDWEPRWHVNDNELNKTLNKILKQLVETANSLADPVLFHNMTLDKGADHYPKDTKGVDNWTATDSRSLPIEGKVRISKALNKSQIKVTQPIQNLINLNAMLGKPGGGARTVCKKPMLYRLSLRARGDVADWEEILTGDFDTAGKGKSALVAAAYRNLEAEFFSYTEEQVIATFHDFEKFFDSIHLPTLIHNVIAHEFPILDLALTIMQHMAPRVIQCAGFCSRPILTNSSILAGCKHSVALNRVFPVRYDPIKD